MRRRSSAFALRAFTLVELMVVIGVIALLIAILLPTLGEARRQANSIACTANLRQWATAVLIYAQQNHGWLPRRGNGQNGAPNIGDVQRPEDWYNALPPILKMKPYNDATTVAAVPRPPQHSIWICPEALDASPQFTFFSYAMNMGLSTWFDPYPSNIGHVKSWTSMIFMTDSSAWFCSSWPKAGTAAFNPPARHNGHVNVAFLDGHVASFAAAEIGSGFGVPQRSDLRWWSPDSKWPGP